MPSSVAGGTGTTRCDRLDFGHCRRPCRVITSTTWSRATQPVHPVAVQAGDLAEPQAHLHAELGQRPPLRAAMLPAAAYSAAASSGS